jgi:DNA-binding CsgD family transcriptional regulator/GAF domain-containing protein
MASKRIHWLGGVQMMDSELNTLLLNLYDCPNNGRRWPQVLDGIRDRLRVRCAAVQILSTATAPVTVRWVARDSESQAHRGHHDPFICGDQNPRLRVVPPRSDFSNRFMRDRDYCQGDDRDLAHLQRRLADLGLGSCLSAGVGLSKHESLVLVLHRDVRDRGDFSHQDEALIAAVMPHLRQAISLSEQLEAARGHNSGLRQAADRLSLGLALCDAEGRPSWVNLAARSAFRDHDALRVTHGRLTGACASETEALRRAIAQAAEEASMSRSGERCLVLKGSESAAALQVLVVPLRCEAVPGSPTASSQVLVMFSSVCAKPILAPALVGALFALSPAESRLAVALCQGHTVNEYAALHGVSVGTARFQLKQVLAKTQAPRQSELVRRVCTSVVAHAMRLDAC